MATFLENPLAENPDPTKYEPEEYGRHLKAFQVFFREFVLERLTLLGVLDSINSETGVEATPTTFGSDGRFEKPLLRKITNGNGHASKLVETGELQQLSPLQIAFVTEQAVSPEQRDKLTRACQPIVDYFGRAVYDEFSFLSVRQESLSGFTDKNGRTHFHPSRIFDASLIGTGLDEHWSRASGHSCIGAVRRQLALELRACIKVILPQQQEMLKGHRKLTLTGQQTVRGRVLQHFDRETGQLFLERRHTTELSDVASVKYGPLRLVQIYIVREACKYIASTSAEADGMFVQLPTATVDKLSYLLDEMKLNGARVRELQNLYSYFLWMYNLSQYKARQGDRSIVVDKVQLNENMNDLLRLLNLSTETINPSTPFAALR